MISEKPVVQELVALMLAHGVTRAVLCPGSRNSPIVATLAACADVECRSVTDERSAGFVALGWAQQVQAPVAVVVTSGSAVLNVHPAVAEAFDGGLMETINTEILKDAVDAALKA